MNDTYDLFAFIYRDLIEATGRLNAIKHLVKHLISVIEIKTDHRILDIACGTGDVLFEFYKNGIKDVTGIDSSVNMISQAKVILPEAQLINGSWDEINNNIPKKECFNLITSTSISLMHADSFIEFQRILYSISNMLCENGVFVIDNRNWDFDKKTKKLIQRNREVNSCQFLAEIKKGNSTYSITDNCFYEKDRQYVEYTIIKNNSQKENILVSYLKIHTKDLIKLLYKYGYQKVWVNNINKWPYDIIYAKK